MSERVNSETVAGGNYAVFAGLPLALWGLIGYLMMGVLMIGSLRKSNESRSLPFGFLFLSLITLFITVIEFFSRSSSPARGVAPWLGLEIMKFSFDAI